MNKMSKQTAFNISITLLVLLMLGHVWRGHETVPVATPAAIPTDDRSGNRSPPAYSDPVAPRADIDINTLAKLLQGEQEVRRRLENHVAELSVQVQILARQGGDQETTSAPASASGSASPGLDTTGNGNANSGWIDEQILLDSGINISQAKNIKKQFETMEMDRLFLRDRATREGWIGTARYVDEVEKLNERVTSIREEVGEANYGAYLYAIGQPNQVIAESVLESSPAQQAGVQAGDVIVRYDDKYIYTWSDVRAATSSGEAGQQVRLILSRNGEPIDTYITRGPMGVRLSVRREKP